MNLNFKLFNAFLLVAECGSLKAAAHRANRSLPAISMQIKQLEGQVGLPLFDRQRRQMVLTPAGEQLLTSTRKAFQTMDAGLRQLRQTLELEHGHVALACSPTIATARLPPILSSFSRRYPGIHLHLRELSLEEQLGSLKRQEVDFSIGPRPDDTDTAIVFEPLMRDDILALVPADHALARHQAITLEQFVRSPMVMLSRDAGFRRTLDTILQAAGMQPARILCEAKQISTLIAIVQAGMGAALLPRIALHGSPYLACQPRELVVLPLTQPGLSRDIGILTLKDSRPSPAAMQLCNLVRQDLLPPGSA